MVTGAGGSIGSELCFQILKFQPSKLILLDRDENSSYEVRNRLLPYVTEDQLEVIVGDVTNSSKLTRVFGRFQPEIVFHAAADKQVPLMELNPDEAVFNNIFGTQTVLDIATHSGVEKVVCISTDKAVNPSSVMGCCKRVTELLLPSRVSTQTVCCAVRFGNVLGSRGSVVPLFKKQIAQGGPVTVTHPDIKRYFMTIQEAVILVLQAGALSTGGEIFLLEMGEQIRIQDLAQQMIELSGRKNGEVPIEFIGLRPGEKLKEELSFDHETIEKTISSKIYRLSSNGESVNRLYFRNRIEKLRLLATEMDFEGIRAVLKDLVPEYRPEGQPWISTAKAIQRETLSAK
jgi:FlaA1/EpsC-like NDP-sugar epimerase